MTLTQKKDHSWDCWFSLALIQFVKIRLFYNLDIDRVNCCWHCNAILISALQFV